MTQIQTPITPDAIKNLKIGDHIAISGTIYSGRDAVLPKLVRMAESEPERVKTLFMGGVVFHTAVSAAGIGPTSSNKAEIEASIGPLSEMGVKIHLGKGALHKGTIHALNKHNAVFAITPPVSALLTSKVITKEVAMFPEEGMEALHRLKVSDLPAIVAIAHGESIF